MVLSVKLETGSCCLPVACKSSGRTKLYGVMSLHGCHPLLLLSPAAHLFKERSGTSQKLDSTRLGCCHCHRATELERQADLKVKLQTEFFGHEARQGVEECQANRVGSSVGAAMLRPVQAAV